MLRFHKIHIHNQLSQKLHSQCSVPIKCTISNSALIKSTFTKTQLSKISNCNPQHSLNSYSQWSALIYSHFQNSALIEFTFASPSFHNFILSMLSSQCSALIKCTILKLSSHKIHICNAQLSLKFTFAMLSSHKIQICKTQLSWNSHL